jgi:hypothetical protein
MMFGLCKSESIFRTVPVIYTIFLHKNMNYILSEAMDWLKGSAFGYRRRDRIFLFMYIFNAIVVIIFLLPFTER